MHCLFLWDICRVSLLLSDKKRKSVLQAFSFDLSLLSGAKKSPVSLWVRCFIVTAPFRPFSTALFIASTSLSSTIRKSPLLSIFILLSFLSWCLFCPLFSLPLPALRFLLLHPLPFLSGLIQWNSAFPRCHCVSFLTTTLLPSPWHFEFRTSVRLLPFSLSISISS